MKQLHEKTIRELDIEKCINGDYVVLISELKNWAIAILKQMKKEGRGFCKVCGKIAIKDYDGLAFCEKDDKWWGDWGDIAIANFLLDKFEIKESDL